MEINNTFNVALPPDKAWAVLMDIERVAPCMPGAEITEVVDDRTFKGKVSVKLGPVALTFGGTAKFEEIDDAARTALVSARGTDPKGRGGADAKVNFALAPDGDGSRVDIKSDVQLSGAVAQYGRGAGMISDLAAQLVGQFADNLNAQLAAENPPDQPDAASAAEAPVGAPETPPAAKPISGLNLGLRLLWNAIKRLFGKA